MVIIRWSIILMAFIIFSLHLTVIVLNYHATTRVSEQIPDSDPHIWGAGPENGGLCEMSWFSRSPNNNSTEISCYIRSVINNLLRTFLVANNHKLAFYEVTDDRNGNEVTKTAVQKIEQSGYGFDRTLLVPNELIARVCEAASPDPNPVPFTVGNILDYQRSGMGSGRKDTAIDRHLSSFIFPGDYLVLDTTATIPNETSDDQKMNNDISEGRATNNNGTARYFRFDYIHTLMLCLFELPPDNILEVVLIDNVDRNSIFTDEDKSITENKITKSVNEWLKPLNEAFPKFPKSIVAKVKAFIGRDGNVRIQNTNFQIDSQTYIDTTFGQGATLQSIVDAAGKTKSSSSFHLKRIFYVHMQEYKKNDWLGFIRIELPLVFNIVENFKDRSTKNFACVTGSLQTYKHEIGHMLHMDHYYDGRRTSGNKLLSFMSLADLYKPVPVNNCEFDVPFTVMYTESNVTHLDAAFVQHVWAYMYNGTKYPSRPISDRKNYWASRVDVFDDSGPPLRKSKGVVLPDFSTLPFHKETTTTKNKRPGGTDKRMYYFDFFMKNSIPFDIAALLFNGINLYLAFRGHTSIPGYYMRLSFYLPISIIGIILIGGLLSQATEKHDEIPPSIFVAASSIMIIFIIILTIIFAIIISGNKKKSTTKAKKWIPSVIMIQTFALNIVYYEFLRQRHIQWEECKQSGEAFHSNNIEIILNVMIGLSVVFLLMCLPYFYGLTPVSVHAAASTASTAPTASTASSTTSNPSSAASTRVPPIMKPTNTTSSASSTTSNPSSASRLTRLPPINNRQTIQLTELRTKLRTKLPQIVPGK